MDLIVVSLHSTSFLEPHDPLFIQIGSLFVSLFQQEFGEIHFYNGDPFNEMLPRTGLVRNLTS